MTILKIGMFDWPESRWEDSLEVFDKVLLFQDDENFNENFTWIERFPLSQNNTLRKKINSYFFILLEKSVKYKILYQFIILFMRLFNVKTLSKIGSLKFDYVYSSYNDYDKSDHLTVLLYPFIKKKFIVRSVKETRNYYRFSELFCFNKAHLIVFNSIHHQKFFESKYSQNFNPSIINIDEDYRPKKYYKNFISREKFSANSENIHIVILSGRVFSDITNIRSGARQYYIDLIKECVQIGYHVDLFTGEIRNDTNGVNQYAELEKTSNGLFSIKGSLDLRNDPNESYSILSSYDFGILHNYIEGADVSKFDNVNIPNRIYEYLISNVIPIVPKGHSIVIEELFKSKGIGCIYSNLKDLRTFKNEKTTSFNPSFLEYLQKINKEVKENYVQT